MVVILIVSTGCVTIVPKSRNICFIFVTSRYRGDMLLYIYMYYSFSLFVPILQIVAAGNNYKLL